jgi:uncharacterized protein (TIGR03437 family)
MRLVLLFSLCAAVLLAQAPPTNPVLNPRGVVNAFTQQPAPSTVAPGGLIWIQGLNLGPADGLVAPGSSWPLKLAGWEVLINNTPAPIGSISPGKIVAQVPYETVLGLAQVVVRSGSGSSAPARFFVSGPTFPSVRAANDLGFGDALGSPDAVITLAVSGLGVTEPRIETGRAATTDSPASPRATIRGYVGGLPAKTTATLSTVRVGEFDVTLEIPAAAASGDVISVIAGNRAANGLTYKKSGAADLQYLPFPDGTPELRDLVSSDLRGSLVLANGARDASGCYPSYSFDLSRKKAALLDSCLTAGNANASTPAVIANDASTIAALVGPPEGTLPSGVSSKVVILNPTGDSAISAQLPAYATNVVGGQDGNFTALLSGTPPSAVSIDAQTGEVKPVQGNIAPGGAAGAAGVGGAAGLVFLNTMIDLGDGVSNILSQPVQVRPNQVALIAGDDADAPKKAKLGVLSPQGAVIGTKDFPDGWLPLLAPQAPNSGTGGIGGGGGFPGIPGGGGIPAAGGGGLQARFRVTTAWDSPSQVLYVLARKPDDSQHGLVMFTFDDAPAKVSQFPDGWFAAACSPNIAFFTLDLSRRLALFGDTTALNAVKNPCPAQGFLLLDLATRTVAAQPLQGNGQMNAAQNSGDVNDYIYATNTDPALRGNADTLFVLDGVTASSFRLTPDPQSGVISFSNVQAVPFLGMLVALATIRTAGDAGFVIFDLDSATTRVLPTPDGFASVQMVGLFTTTRKLVARGTKTGNTGSQYLIYDLLTGDLTMPPNPEGVAFVGGLPTQQGATGGPGGPGVGGGGVAQPPVLQRANTKANTVVAVVYNTDRKQTGIIALRIP